MRSGSQDTHAPAAARLLHPLPVAAIAITALNDHLWKGGHLVPAWLTGKLSDFAGLFFFPVLVVAATRGRVRPAVAALATGLVFALFKLSPAACQWLEPFVVTPDATDLAALPMLGLSWWWMVGRRAPARVDPAWARAVVVGAAALTSAATSPAGGPNFYRPLPMWTVVATGPRALACADVGLWVSQSGREGVGLTLAVRARDAACTLRIERASIVVPGAVNHVAPGFPHDLALAAGQAYHRYLPVPFDGDAAWLLGRWSGHAEVALSAGGAVHTLRFELVYRKAPTPVWGTFWYPIVTACWEVAELIVTDTAPEGVHAVLRFASPREAHTLRIGARSE